MAFRRAADHLHLASLTRGPRPGAPRPPDTSPPPPHGPLRVAGALSWADAAHPVAHKDFSNLQSPSLLFLFSLV
ncbi:hypothetical protein GCM10009546_21400 [Actinomadura livida]|uniref:Uncharacterized protein n=1 Tax=Actinomadura livida TaxID=79909 RepID=A0ABN1E4L1_9ACTN|nr:hypothetical protein GCM10010208_03270 [Actinomadura livida]